MPRGTEFKHLHDLFHLALPRHEDSLTVLSINAPDVKGWFICPDLLSPLYTRQNLVELGLSAFVKVAGAGESVELFSVKDMVTSAVNFRRLSILKIFPVGLIGRVFDAPDSYEEEWRKSVMDNLASFKTSAPERYAFQVTCCGSFFNLLPDPVEVGKYGYTLMP